MGRTPAQTVLAALPVLAACVAPACTHRSPPAPGISPSVAPPEDGPSGAAPVPFAPNAATAPLAPAAGSGVDASSTETAEAHPSAPVEPSSTHGPSSDPRLSQTRDRPKAAGSAFDARVAALWSAIVRDAPDDAMPFFFPLDAYKQVKAVYDPTSDWKHRLVAAYRRDIHALHARLGRVPARATFRGLEVPASQGRWVNPGEEYNKVGYYRVFGSKLRYDLDGHPGHFDVKSLISWRGEWFVVHLSAIR